MVSPAKTAISLIVFVFLSSQFLCNTATCPPPDFPESGKYETEIKEYEAGMTITYFCLNGLMDFNDIKRWNNGQKVVTCQASGNWSKPTLFCDIPTKLKSLTQSADTDSKELIVIDGEGKTCFETRNGTEVILQFSLKGEIVPYAAIFCFKKGGGNLTMRFSTYLKKPYKSNIGDDACVVINHEFNKLKTKNITVEISSKANSSTSLCEVLVFAKDDEWCEDPPENFVSNGQLEVSRSKAVLHCNEGFREKDDRRVYATCLNNAWSYMSLECIRTTCNLAVGNLSSSEGEWKSEDKTSDIFGTIKVLKCEPGYHSEGEPIKVKCLEDGTWSTTSATCKKDKPQKGYNSIALVIGLLIVIVILTLFGSTIFLIRRKKPIGLFVIFKSRRNSRYSSFPFVDDHNTTST